MGTYQHDKVPSAGGRITVNADGSLDVPDQPIIPYIEGDGTGVDITPVMIKVVDAAVAKAYGGKRRIAWMEVYAGEKATKLYGADVWLPEETLGIVKDYVVSIKGPLTTPVGGGIRSLNVALRQELDLYVCLRPVRWFQGVPSPVKHPEKVDMVIFRENTEDIYAGIDFQAGSEAAMKAPSVNFWMLPLCTRVTDFRPLRTAYSMAARTSRFDPVSDTGLMPIPESGRISQANASRSSSMSCFASGVPSSTSNPA